MAKSRPENLPEPPPEPRPPLPPELPAAPAGDSLPPLPVADGSGPLPRLISQNERCPDRERLARWKVRCNNYHPMGQTHYLLARRGDEKAVRAFYLQATGIGEHMDRLAANGLKAEPAELVTKQLED